MRASLILGKRTGRIVDECAQEGCGMGKPKQRVNMFDPAIYRIRINGRLGERWSEYFGAQSMSVEEDEAGLSSTTLVSVPIDQAGLVGMINHLNGLGLPVVSVECLQTLVENELSEQVNA
jgi:hypothetical protein